MLVKFGKFEVSVRFINRSQCLGKLVPMLCYEPCSSFTKSREKNVSYITLSKLLKLYLEILLIHNHLACPPPMDQYHPQSIRFTSLFWVLT